MFQNKKYTIGILVSGLSSGISFGIPYLTPLLLQNVNGLSTIISGFIMFPSALLAAALGMKAGRLASRKGNNVLTYTALSSFLIGYTLLSLMAGLTPFVIIIVLVFACTGQTFIQISLAYTVSRTLPKDQSGVEIGVFMMTNFIAGAAATTFISKALEIKDSSLHLNPFLQNQEGLNFSNIYDV
nr:MFS transporter [Bacillus sp. SA1-12]